MNTKKVNDLEQKKKGVFRVVHYHQTRRADNIFHMYYSMFFYEYGIPNILAIKYVPGPLFRFRKTRIRKIQKNKKIKC